MGPDVLYSASSDGTVKLWDAKQAANKPQAEFRDATATHGTSGGTSGEIWTAASEGGSNLLAAGTESAVAVWDVRKANAAPVARYEVHTEAVTQVRFKPAGGSGILLSGSVDALLCEIDTRIADEDEAVLNVINTEGPVSSLGFYGTDLSRAWVLSSTDVVSTWDLAAGDCLGVRDNLVAHKADDFLLGEARSRERGADGRLPIDFVVGVHWDAASSRLVLVGGDQGGAVHVFEIGAATAPPTPLQSLKAGSGHVDAVRCFRFGAGLASITTGGEDGRLCSWVPAAAAALPRLVLHSALPARRRRRRRRPRRHQAHRPGVRRRSPTRRRRGARRSRTTDRPPARRRWVRRGMTNSSVLRMSRACFVSCDDDLMRAHPLYIYNNKRTTPVEAR